MSLQKLSMVPYFLQFKVKILPFFQNLWITSLPHLSINNSSHANSSTGSGEEAWAAHSEDRALNLSLCLKNNGKVRSGGTGHDRTCI